jgi:hypothetical protein
VWYSIRGDGYRCRTAHRRRAGNLMRATGSVKTAVTCAIDASISDDATEGAPEPDEQGEEPGPTLDIGDAYAAFGRTPGSQFAVALAVPAERVDAPFRRPRGWSR